MTQAEKEEFKDLKYIRAERGFLTEMEKVRWNYLFDKQTKEFVIKAKLGIININ